MATRSSVATMPPTLRLLTGAGRGAAGGGAMGARAGAGAGAAPTEGGGGIAPGAGGGGGDGHGGNWLGQLQLRRLGGGVFTFGRRRGRRGGLGAHRGGVIKSRPEGESTSQWRFLGIRRAVVLPQEVVDLLGRGVLQAAALALQVLHGLDHRLGHALVGFLRAADEEKPSPWVRRLCRSWLSSPRPRRRFFAREERAMAFTLGQSARVSSPRPIPQGRWGRRTRRCRPPLRRRWGLRPPRLSNN